MPDEAKPVYQNDYILVDNTMPNHKIIDMGEALSDKTELIKKAQRVKQRFKSKT